MINENGVSICPRCKQPSTEFTPLEEEDEDAARQWRACRPCKVVWDEACLN